MVQRVACVGPALLLVCAVALLATGANGEIGDACRFDVNGVLVRVYDVQYNHQGKDQALSRHIFSASRQLLEGQDLDRATLRYFDNMCCLRAAPAYDVCSIQLGIHTRKHQAFYNSRAQQQQQQADGQEEEVVSVDKLLEMVDLRPEAAAEAAKHQADVDRIMNMMDIPKPQQQQPQQQAKHSGGAASSPSQSPAAAAGAGKKTPEQATATKALDMLVSAPAPRYKPGDTFQLQYRFEGQSKPCTTTGDKLVLTSRDRSSRGTRTCRVEELVADSTVRGWLMGSYCCRETVVTDNHVYDSEADRQRNREPDRYSCVYAGHSTGQVAAVKKALGLRL